MSQENKNESTIRKGVIIPFYKKPVFASVVIGLLSIAIIMITERYITVGMEAEVALVTEISVATFFMFLLLIVVNHLQSGITKIEATALHSRELEAVRNEFTNIASRDIAEASTAIKWGIRTLEPSFDLLKKNEKETLQHIRDKNDHVLEIVRNLVILSRLERKEIVISKSPTNITGVIENLLSTTGPRAKAKGTQVIFIPPPELVTIETDHIVLSDLLQSLYIYCLERTRGSEDTISIRAFTVDSDKEIITRILITDNAPPVPEYMRKNIFDRAIHNPHTGELESTQLGPHSAYQLAEMLGVSLEATITEDQTSFSISFPPISK